MRSLYRQLKRIAIWAPIRVSLIYFVISFFWILFSDQLVFGVNFSLSPREKEIISMFKGWGFVLASATLIFYSIYRELSKRQAIEKEIIESEQRFRAVFDSAGLGIALVDLHGRIIEVNPALASMVGYSKEELRSMSMFSLLHIEDVSREELRFRQMLKSGGVGPSQSEKRYIRRDGTTFNASVVASLVRNDRRQPIYFVGVVEDITRAKGVEQAKNEFVTLASHQLRTPLTIVGWYVESLLSDVAGKLTQKQRHYFNRIQEANGRMVRLVSDLLNISRIDTDNFVVGQEVLNVAEVAQATLELIRPTIENRLIRIRKNYGGNLERVVLDHNLLGIVLQNLLMNAIKYSHPNSEVILSIVAVDHELDIEVRDSGFGIPKSHFSKMFQKFSRADNIRGVDPNGTGLGLYLVKSLVDKVGGQVWFESEEGQGSVFHVSLPINSKTDNTIHA